MAIKHILLIDDNEIDNHISNYILNKSMIAEKITTIDSALDALELLKSLQEKKEDFPELIFLDIRMPIMDGFDFLEAISEFPNQPFNNTSIYMLTSSDEQNDKQRAAQFSIVKHFFSKPMNQDLLDKIAQLHNQPTNKAN